MDNTLLNDTIKIVVMLLFPNMSKEKGLTRMVIFSVVT